MNAYGENDFSLFGKKGHALLLDRHRLARSLQEQQEALAVTRRVDAGKRYPNRGSRIQQGCHAF